MGLTPRADLKVVTDIGDIDPILHKIVKGGGRVDAGQVDGVAYVTLQPDARAEDVVSEIEAAFGIAEVLRFAM